MSNFVRSISILIEGSLSVFRNHPLMTSNHQTCGVLAAARAKLLLTATFVITGTIQAFEFVNPSYWVAEGQDVNVVLRRTDQTNFLQRVDFYTLDGPPDSLAQVAKSDLDYMSTAGRATFAHGQREVSIRIPLLNNSVVDGPKSFRLMLTNATSGLRLEPPWSFVWIVIEDDEVSADLLPVDPAWVPEIPPGTGYGGDYFLGPLPDGRVLMSRRFLGGSEPAMLLPDGSLDLSFRPPMGLQPFAIAPDGRLWLHEANGRRLVRLNPAGAVEADFIAPVLVPALNKGLVQPDGRLVVLSEGLDGTTIQRLNMDGTLDTSFVAPLLQGSSTPFISLQSDGKILISGLSIVSTNGDTQGLLRLNADGSIDKPFLVNALNSHFPGPFFQRRNAKIIFAGSAPLTPDPGSDESFGLLAIHSKLTSASATRRTSRPSASNGHRARCRSFRI
jgi:hypothetical protein